MCGHHRNIDEKYGTPCSSTKERGLATMYAYLAGGVRRIITLLLIFFFSALSLSQETAAPDRKYALDRILVKFRQAAAESARTAVHASLGSHTVKRYQAAANVELVGLPNSLDVTDALRAYRQRPEVEYAEPDYVVHLIGTPNDPLFPQVWNLLNTGQNGGTAGDDIAATLAWNLSTGDHNVVVATLDTGIDYTHPDLLPNLFRNTAVCDGVNDGTNGCYGISTVYYTSNTLDDNGHGTHVSGTIGAAGNNNLGVVGINWNVQLLTCKFLDSNGNGQTSDAISCLDYVLQMKNAGYNVVATNNSWGGGEYSQALVDAIQAQLQAGILFVTAAGNDFSNNDVNPVFPANTLLSNVISVAATTRTDSLAVFSNTGRHTVHLGAPGQEILSTWPGGNYAILSGTSMATPHVAGAIALLAAQNPNLNWSSLKNLILTGGTSRASLSQTVTAKRLNLNGSMTCSGKTVESRLQPVNDVVAATIGAPLTLQELNVNCSQPAGAVQVTVSPGGQTITLTDNGTGADQVSGDGIYSAQWTPSATGSYTLTFPAADVVPVEVLSNYVVTPTPYNYFTIAGTNLNLGDDATAQITSPFPISFGGGSFSKLQIGSNGTISFTDAYSPFDNEVIPGSAPVPITLVAPFWQDLYPVAGSAQNVYWAVAGAAPTRRLIVEWRNVRSFLCHSDASASITFEVIFSESSGDILFEYADTSFGDYCYFQDAGARATVGIQVSPSIGKMWTVNDPVISSGSALLWTVGNNIPPNNPLPIITSLSPSSAPVGGPAFTLTVNGTGFVPTSAVNFDLYDRPTTFVSSTQLKAEIPASAIGPNVAPSTYVSVVNPPPGGGESNLITFPLSSAAPTITSLSPSSVTAGAFSFSLTINGTGFNPAQSEVYWNGTLLGLGTFIDPTQMIIGVGYNLIKTPGPVQITVVNVPPGGGTSNATTLTVLSPAQVPVYLQPPQFINAPGAAAPLNPGSPARFLGWKYAARGGPDYLKAFSRPRAQAPLAPPNPILSDSLGGSTITGGLTGTPALVGLASHFLMPADFIPTGVAAGDFNGDGIPDWVVSNGGSNSLWVYLGRGDGTFSKATVIPLAGQSPIAVAAADLRGIGRTDLIVAEADSASVGVLLGNGDGTFAQEKTYFVPGSPISLSVTDLNHDGHLDVLAGVAVDLFGPLSGPLVTLPGDGSGNLGLPIYEPFYFFDVQVPVSVVTADFERNGKPDVVAVQPGLGAVFYVNDGAGRFKEAQAINGAFIITPLTATAGDVNEDGCPDVITFDNLGIARVFPGNCDGTFQQQSNQLGEGDFGWASTLIDVNGDGHLDLVYSGISAQTGYGQVAGNLLAVNLGDGKGNFGPARVYRGGQSSFALAVADFNHDGHPDVITANQDSDSATIFLNDGSGGFGVPAGEYAGYINGNNSSGPVNAPYSSFIPADVNGDGKPDLVLLEVGPGYPNPFQAAVMLNNGTGRFGPAVMSSAAEGTSDVYDYLLGDFRNSGRPDLITLASSGGSHSQLVFAPNVGGGSFGTPRITPLSNLTLFGILASGDFNHDGNLDLAVATGVSQNGIASVTIYLGHRDGTFTAQAPITIDQNSPGHWIQGLWVGDFNGDGKLDLLVWFYLNVVPFQNNDVYELLGNGDGTFAPAKLVIQNLTNPSMVDVNRDGRPDVVDNQQPEITYPNGLANPKFSIYICQSDGSFISTNSYSPYTGVTASPTTLGTRLGERFPVWIGDFNGDGNVDLAAIQSATNYPARVSYVQFLLGNGDGTFTPSYVPYFFNGSVPTTAFDFTGDGRADFVESDTYTSSFQVIPAVPGSALQIQMVSDPVIGANGAVLISLATVASNSTQVSLTASDPAIAVQASVTVPAGSLSQIVPFTIGKSFDPTHVFWIQGTLGSSTSVAYGTQVMAKGQYGVALYTVNSTESVFPGLATPDYSLGLNSLAGYSTTVTLSCNGLPEGATCQFGSNSLSVVSGGSASTSLIVNTTPNIALGTYRFTIQATDGAITSTTNATLNVGDYTVSITPNSLTALQNTTANYTVTITPINNYSANLTGSCSGIPAPASCSFNGPVIQYSTPLSIQTNSLALGTYNFTAAVSNGVATRSASAQLNIGDFNATLSTSALSVPVGTSGSVTINVTGENGFADPVALSCSGAPNGTTCSINPGSVTPSSGGTSATMTVAVAVRPASARSQPLPTRRLTSITFLAASGMFAMLLILPIPTRSSARRFGASLAAIAVVACIVSCGGSGAGGGGGGGGGGGATTFNLTVQATADGVTKNAGTVKVTVP